MADSAAILRALKAAQSRSQARSSALLSGGPSPLVAQYQQWSAGRSYGPFLPRPAADFLTGAFGPLAPIQPVGIDEPEDGEERPEPRRWEYPVGWNMPIGTPGSEGLKLASFDTLRTYADMYSVARNCIRVRKDEICGLGWDIQMTPEAEKAARGDRKAHRDFQQRRQKALKFFRRPDPNYADFSSWLSALLDDFFAIDALCVYLHPARGKRAGLLGSNLAALDALDGSTIRPLVDLRGSTPAPPAVAYQQYLWGVPRSDLMAIAANQDVADMAEALVAEYRGDQLLYLPYTRRTWTPYGFSTIESVVLPLVTGLMRQKYAYDYFQEGSIPGMFVTPSDETLTPSQLREMQDALNALAGDPAWKHKIVVLPGKADPMKPVQLADEYDTIVMAQTMMGFDIQPSEFGFVMGRAARVEEKKTEVQRPSLKPILKWFKSTLFNFILQDVCGQDDMTWKWEGEGDDPTPDQVSMWKDMVTVGGLSIDEMRQKAGEAPWGLPMTSDPGILTATGFVPLGSIDPETGKPLDGHPAGQPGQQSPAAGNAPGGPGTPAPPAAPLPPASGREAASRGGTPLHDGSQAAVKPPGKAPQKAVMAELGALRRHLHKGRRISTWRARHLPAHAVAAIAEDLAKGLTVDQAVDVTAATLTKAAGGPADEADSGEEPPADAWPGWEHDIALAAVYAPQIAAALRAGIVPAELARRWLDAAHLGDPGDARGWLEGQGVAGRIVQELIGVLQHLWTEAWHLGQRAAVATVRAEPPDWDGWEPGNHVAAARLTAGARGLQDLLDSYSVHEIKAIADTRMGELAQTLADALEAGDSPEKLAATIRGLLEVPGRAQMIADTETARAVSQATLATYDGAHVDAVEWLVAPDDRVCEVCAGNAALGPVPLGHQFAHKPGSADGPPAHPSCRCTLIPAAAAGVDLTGKAGTVSKASVHYRPSREPARRCGTCSMFLPQGACTLVRGRIAPGMVCDEWDPRPVTKAAARAELIDPEPVDADVVIGQMRDNFPDTALTWMKNVRWVKAQVPHDAIDYQDVDSWAASHQPKKVAKFVKKLRKGKDVNPIVAVQQPGKDRVVIVDGHHRTLAHQQLGEPVPAYVGFVPRKVGPWLRTFQYQVHHGADPANKTAGPTVAGLAVRAADTGRVLMLQRALTDDDPAAGCWEFPGGHLEPGETAEDAARREWAEEAGMQAPDGRVTGGWTSPDGVYEGIVLTVASEDTVPVFGDRDQVSNPDDPDGDQIEALAWWDPAQFTDNPAVRPELARDLDRVLPALTRAPIAKLYDARGHIEALKVDEGAAGDYRARHLIAWYNEGADGRIPWGAPGDFDACVAVASEHMSPEKARGFCANRHHDALGIWPATHSARERHGK